MVEAVAGSAQEELCAVPALRVCSVHSVVQLNGLEHHRIRPETYSYEHCRYGLVELAAIFETNKNNIIIV